MFVLVHSFHRSIVSSYVVVLLAAEKPARWERRLLRKTKGCVRYTTHVRPNAKIIVSQTTSTRAWPTLFVVPFSAAGGAAAASAYKSEARLRQLLVGGEIFLGSALSASLTKMTLRAMDLLGESSPAAKEMQVCIMCVCVCVHVCVLVSCPQVWRVLFFSYAASFCRVDKRVPPTPLVDRASNIQPWSLCVANTKALREVCM